MLRAGGTPLARTLYSLFFYLIMPLVMARLLWRSRRAPAYRRRWAERFGRVPAPPPGPVIWVHAVSVGETLAAIPLIRALRQHMQLTQTEFADVLAVRQPTISEWETGAYEPKRSTSKLLTLIAERAGFPYTT